MKPTDTAPQIFSRRKVLIVGDIVADQFLSGTISRVSREAPVFILRHDATDTVAGGAANTAANVAALGGQPILVGIVGRDKNGELLSDAFARDGIETQTLVIDDSFQTTTKVRVLAGQNYAARQQVIRIDYENRTVISKATIKQLIENIRIEVAGAAAIVLSDYGYGVACREVFAETLRQARACRIPLIADSRFRLRDFTGATSATPNLEEVESILGKHFTDEDCKRLCSELKLDALLVTCGNDGVLLIEKSGTAEHLPAVGSHEPVDVTGAGDTVIAAYSLGLASGMTYREAANAANHAGGLVVMKKGTSVVSAAELATSMAAAASAARV